MKYLEAQRLKREQEREREAGEKQAAGPPENKMRPPPANKAEWTMAMSPARYIAMNEDSENPDVQERVALARRIVADADD